MAFELINSPSLAGGRPFCRNAECRDFTAARLAKLPDKGADFGGLSNAGGSPRSGRRRRQMQRPVF